jgi:hypothetical protein
VAFHAPVPGSAQQPALLAQRPLPTVQRAQELALLAPSSLAARRARVPCVLQVALWPRPVSSQQRVACALQALTAAPEQQTARAAPQAGLRLQVLQAPATAPFAPTASMTLARLMCAWRATPRLPWEESMCRHLRQRLAAQAQHPVHAAALAPRAEPSLTRRLAQAAAPALLAPTSRSAQDCSLPAMKRRQAPLHLLVLPSRLLAGRVLPRSLALLVRRTASGAQLALFLPL